MSASYTLELFLNTNAKDNIIMSKRFRIAEFIYNACLSELHRRYKTYLGSKNRKSIIRYNYKNKVKRLSKLKVKYGLTEYSLHNYVKPMQKKFKTNIDSFTAQKIASRCFKAFSKYMKGDCKKVNYKSKGDILSVEGKSNATGIKYKDGFVIWNGLEIPVKIKKNDTYAQICIQDKVKYSRLKRQYIRGKEIYSVQLIMEGIPYLKDRKIGQGSVGIDIGTSSIAVCSDIKCLLEELAKESQNIERKLFIINRKLDRSRRITNSSNYNNDGTIKKGKKVWVKSKRYIKLQLLRRELYRKQAIVRRQSHNTLANELLKLGNVFKVESMSFKGLQKRTKETTVNFKGKFKSKKRFGKTLSNRAPSMLLEILKQKLKYFGLDLLKIKTSKVKASQYNHVTNTYSKKNLSERWNDFGNFKIQRDLYSAFLIKNTVDTLDSIDRDKCIKEFEKFKIQHDNVVNNLKEMKLSKPILKSFGLK